MKNLMKTAAAFLLGIQVCACSQVENKVSPAIPSDPEIEANIRQWLKKMTLEEKIGQMCEITIDVVTDFEASKKNGFTLSEAKLDTVIGKRPYAVFHFTHRDAGKTFCSFHGSRTQRSIERDGQFGSE